MLPDRLLIHQVTIVNPAEDIDAYGNQIWDYEHSGAVTVPGWLQQDSRGEQFGEGRATDTESWLLMTNHAEITDKARVEWTGPNGLMIFELDGPAAPVYAGLAQTYHHTEARLRRIEG